MTWLCVHILMTQVIMVSTNLAVLCGSLAAHTNLTLVPMQLLPNGLECLCVNLFKHRKAPAHLQQLIS